MRKSAYLFVFVNAAGQTVDAGIYETPFPKITDRQFQLGAKMTLLVDQEDPMMAGRQGSLLSLINRTAKSNPWAFTLPTLAAQLYRLTLLDAAQRANWQTGGYALASGMKGSRHGPLGLGSSAAAAGCPGCGSTASAGACSRCGSRRVETAALAAMVSNASPFMNRFAEAAAPAAPSPCQCGSGGRRAGCTGNCATCPNRGR